MEEIFAFIIAMAILIPLLVGVYFETVEEENEDDWEWNLDIWECLLKNKMKQDK